VLHIYIYIYIYIYDISRLRVNNDTTHLYYSGITGGTLLIRN